jgi:hypothetical protein
MSPFLRMFRKRFLQQKERTNPQIYVESLIMLENISKLKYNKAMSSKSNARR